MLLKVIATGSTGNAYLLDFGADQLLIECGVRWQRIQEALGFDLSRLRAVFISHEHQDHGRCIGKVLGAGMPCIMSRGTMEALGLSGSNPLIKDHRDAEQFNLGPFTAVQFQTQHDAADPCGWLIRYRPTGETLLYATDTYYLRYRPRGVHYYLIECNYVAETLERNILAGRIPEEMRGRLLHSHFSLENVLGFFRETDTSKTRGIVLLHMSDSNSDEGRMVEAVQAATGIETWAARAGLEIHMRLTPF